MQDIEGLRPAPVLAVQSSEAKCMSSAALFEGGYAGTRGSMNAKLSVKEMQHDIAAASPASTLVFLHLNLIYSVKMM